HVDLWISPEFGVIAWVMALRVLHRARVRRTLASRPRRRRRRLHLSAFALRKLAAGAATSSPFLRSLPPGSIRPGIESPSCFARLHRQEFLIAVDSDDAVGLLIESPRRHGRCVRQFCRAPRKLAFVGRCVAEEE